MYFIATAVSFVPGFTAASFLLHEAEAKPMKAERKNILQLLYIIFVLTILFLKHIAEINRIIIRTKKAWRCRASPSCANV